MNRPVFIVVSLLCWLTLLVGSYFKVQKMKYADHLIIGAIVTFIISCVLLAIGDLVRERSVKRKMKKE